MKRIGKKTALAVAAGAVVLGLGAALGVSAAIGSEADRQAEQALDLAGASMQAAQRAHAEALERLERTELEALEQHERGTALSEASDAAMIADPELKTSLQTALQRLADTAEIPVAHAAEADDAAAASNAESRKPQETVARQPASPAEPTERPAGRAEQQAATAKILAEAESLEAETGESERRSERIEQSIETLRNAITGLLESAHAKAATLEIPELASQEAIDAFTAAYTALHQAAPASDPTALMQNYQLAWQAVVASNDEAQAALAATPQSAPGGASGGGEPTYIGGILIANKTYALPSWYGSGMTAETMSAFYAMQSEAASLGLNIYISSGFRSYWDQAALYDAYVARDGQAAADRYSARPGHSEHQTGLTFDLNNIGESFAYTPEGEWVRDNAHRFGFVIRYPPGKEHITGYMWEPWHLRYLGTDVATALYSSGLSLEEYLGITSQYAY